MLVFKNSTDCSTAMAERICLRRSLSVVTICRNQSQIHRAHQFMSYGSSSGKVHVASQHLTSSFGYLESIPTETEVMSAVWPALSLRGLLVRSNPCFCGWWRSFCRYGRSTTCRRRCCLCTSPLSATSNSRPYSWSERTLHLSRRKT